VNYGYGFFDRDGIRLWGTDPSTKKPFYHGRIDSEDVIADLDRIFATKEDVKEVVEEESIEERIKREEERREHPDAVPLKVRKKEGRASYYCPKCKTIESRLYFKLVFTGGSYEPVYRCEKCRSEKIYAYYDKGAFYFVDSRKPLSLCCPECGSDDLIYGLIDWD